MKTRKVIITVAQTGAFQGRETIPSIPLQPDEIARSAYDCWNAGASIVHIHARDTNGVSTNDPNVFSEIGSLIKAKTNLILQYSTSPASVSGTTAEDGMKLLYAKDLFKPEMCSVDCSLIGTTWEDRTFVYEWTKPFLNRHVKRMKELGIKPEFECFNIETVEEVFNGLFPATLLDDPVNLSFVMGMNRISQGAVSFSEENLDFMVRKLPTDRKVNFSSVCIGARNHIQGNVLSVLKGGNMRVGMEDNIYYAPGRLLKSNAEIVERAVRLIHELGLEVASPDEARQILGLEKS